VEPEANNQTDQASQPSKKTEKRIVEDSVEQTLKILDKKRER